MKELALVTIHGMGKHKPYYFADLEDKLKRMLGRENWDKISFQNVQYAPILQGPQNKLWNDIIRNKDNDIDATKLRKFFLFGFGDAGSLEYSAHSKDKKEYLAVQAEIQSVLSKAYLELGSNKKKPIIIIAQSLGCQVISNYLWDASKGINIFEKMKGNNSDKNDFLKLKSLRKLVTTGCNIPLFISGLKTRKCFKKPNTKFEWDNFYDPDDVLGWPLRQLDKTFEFINDYDINAGGLLTSWNPLSHGQYWSDNSVLRPLSQSILFLLDQK